MDKLELQEKIWGGIFGVIAILAAIAELIAGGISAASVFGTIKDISGTLVVVVVMVAVAKLIAPKKQAKSFEERMDDALNEWIQEHSNMIVRTSKMPKEHLNDFGMSMTTDITRFFNTETLKSDSSNSVGRFLRITEIDKKKYSASGVHVDFFLNAQTYCASSDPTEIMHELEQLSKNLSLYIIGVVDGITVGDCRKEGDRTVLVPVEFTEPLVTENEERIDAVINLIDRMYEAMLVAARRREK